MRNLRQKMDTPTVVLSIFSSNQMDTPQTADSSIFKAPADVHRFSLARNDGTSSYQMLAGAFRFVCQNGMVAGDNVADIRVPHKGNVVQNVINGAFDVLDGFDLIREQKDGMRDVALDRDEQHAFARSALALRYAPTDTGAPAPVTESQFLAPRRFEDRRDDLWTVFNRVQENLTKGGLHGRSRTGRSMSTRPITGIDQNVKLNRALWMLADAMRQMKA
jgi:hypothetical protein